MKAIAINGSARKDGNTAHMLRALFAELDNEGIETGLIQLANQKIYSCRACGKCWENKDKKCVIEKDIVNEIIIEMESSKAIILGSPTYFANITSQMKALIDRAGLVGMANNNMYKRKVGAGVVAVRRGGAIDAFNALNHFFLINQMIVVGSSYWNLGFGQAENDVLSDAEGMTTMKNLGINMAWLMKRLY